MSMLGHKNNWGRIICALSAFFIPFGLHARFQNNVVDPQPLFTPKGLNKYPTVNIDQKNDKAVDIVNVSISPYYMTSNTGHDKNSGSVKNGDIYGYWNMLGFFLGKKGADNVTGDVFTGAEPDWTAFSNYPGISAAYEAILAGSDGNGPGYVTDLFYTTTNSSSSAVDSAGLFNEKIGQFSVEAAMRRMGVRTEIEYRLFHNLRASMRTGFAEYRIRPIFRSLGASNTASDSTALGEINKKIIAESDYKLLFKEVGLSVDPHTAAVMEDIHFQLSYDYEFAFKSKKGNTVLNVVPYLAIGLWAPTGPKKNIDRAFQIPCGNNGLIAGTADFAVSLDFKDMVTFSFGGGVTLTEDQDQHLDRVPTSTFQSGFFPWKSQVSRQIGATWYLNASMQSLNFIDGFSFYGDITIAAHETDKVTITEANATKAALLKSIDAAGILAEMSAWRSQNYNLGLDIELTPNLIMGLGMQGGLGGDRKSVV